MTKFIYPILAKAIFSTSVYKEIAPTEILTTAMRLVRSAQKTIRATMNAAEEIKSPLPRKYFLLLQRKMDSGILIRRLGFGSEKDFSRINDRIKFFHHYYQFHRTKSRNYMRMLLVDDSKLLFAVREKTYNRYFYTENKKLVGYYKKYFQSYWKTR